MAYDSVGCFWYNGWPGAGHVLFVAFVSHLMENVVREEAYYRAFAMKTGAPFVFFVAPVPIYLLARWIGRKVKSRGLQHGILLAAAMYLLDAAIVVISGQGEFLLTAGSLLAHGAKSIAAIAGGWAAQRE